MFEHFCRDLLRRCCRKIKSDVFNAHCCKYRLNHIEMEPQPVVGNHQTPGKETVDLRMKLKLGANVGSANVVKREA